MEPDVSQEATTTETVSPIAPRAGYIFSVLEISPAPRRRRPRAPRIHQRRRRGERWGRQSAFARCGGWQPGCGSDSAMLRLARQAYGEGPGRSRSGPISAIRSSCSLAPTPHAVPPPQSSLWRAVPPPLIQPPPPRLSYQQRCRSQISLGIRGGCCSGCRIGCRCVRFPRRPRRDLSRRIERRRHLARRCSAAPARRVWCGVSVGG